MIAFTWERHTARSGPPSLAEIYESFFVQLASGKAAADRERHGPIAAASETLLIALKNRGLLDERAALPDAMLWLMGRVAWEAQMLEQRHPPEPLTRRHIDNLLQDGDLRVPTDVAHAIKIGLVLALQADLRSADHQILFGHQSFREFLVGRHWAMQLHRIVSGSPREWDDRTAALLGGRLLAETNKSLDFLMQIVNAEVDPRGLPSPFTWTDADRKGLVDWAQEVFSNEDQNFRRERTNVHGTRARDDMRAVLREAALAIGSLTKDSPGLHAHAPHTLRSILAWFWLHYVEALIVAPRANLPGAELGSASLQQAVLDGATLNGANLADADLWHASLVGASLVAVDLSRAYLIETNLERVDLGNSVLSDASLQGAVLSAARLDNAVLIEAQLLGTNLVAASLNCAQLFAVDLSGSNLEGAQLTHANLERANLRHANLTSANLELADLTNARLHGTDLTGAKLDGAKLYGADLIGIRLDGAHYDEQTIWPEGFDPIAHGAILTSTT